METGIGWRPKTRLGRMVANGEIKNMSEALRSGLPIREPEIADMLLPNLEDKVLDVNMVQRMTDSGRRVNFVITTVVGNHDGFVGIGRSRGKEVGPTIKRSIEEAKKNIMEIRRGCGSWECGCAQPHSLPFEVTGKSGSVEVTLKPAPRGVSLAVGDVSKYILGVAGIKDAWGFTDGHTKTTVNYALATINALRNTAKMRVRREQEDRLKIVSGLSPLAPPQDVQAPTTATETPAGAADAVEERPADDQATAQSPPADGKPAKKTEGNIPASSGDKEDGK